MRDCCRRSGHRTISAARANAHDDAFRLSIAAAKNEVLCFGKIHFGEKLSRKAHSRVTKSMTTYSNEERPRKLSSAVNLDQNESVETTRVTIEENCTCYAHYSVFLFENDGEKSPSRNALRFSTNEEEGEEQLALAIYVGQPNARHVACKGVDECLRLMKNVGEKASFVIPPSLGYGDAGNISFPSIPPKCELLVEIELLHVEGTKETPDTNRADLTFEKRMERCENLKKKGNEKFRDGSKKAAVRLYESGLSYITEDLMQQLVLPKHVDLAEELRATLRLNMGGSFLALKEYALCVKYCDLARGEGVWGDAVKRCHFFREKKEDSCWLTKPQQVKAMFRKAQALESMPGEKYEEAMSVLQEVHDSLDAELERRYVKANGRRQGNAETVFFNALDPEHHEDAKMFEMFRSDFLLSVEKINRVTKLIEKREKMSMAEFCGVFEKKT